MYNKVFVAFLVSFLLVVLIMPHFIKYLKSISFNQNVNMYALPEYKNKAKTPVMGGVLFVLVTIFTTLVTDINSIKSIETSIVILAFVGYAIIGFIDDYLIVVRHNNDGLLPKYKFTMQLLLAVIFYVIYQEYVDLNVYIPIINISINFSVFYAFLVFFMFTGSSNAVNITDGMDGLAGGCMVIALVPFLIFAILQNNISVAIFISSLIGALIGFLKFNVSVAKIYMGDTGSLALGAILAAISMVLKKEFVLIIIGGVFVWETLCVIIQLTVFRLFRFRIFSYTPIHYSFTLKGISEKRVVRSFWVLSLICSIVGLIIGLL